VSAIAVTCSLSIMSMQLGPQILTIPVVIQLMAGTVGWFHAVRPPTTGDLSAQRAPLDGALKVYIFSYMID